MLARRLTLVVVAATVAAADAAVTALSIVGAMAGADLASSLGHDVIAWFVVDVDGTQRCSENWASAA